MYDTSWPRPGPAMATVAAVLGLVAGIVLGLFSPGAQPGAEASPPVETTVGPTTTTTLPERFHTVILGSFDERANAQTRLSVVRSQGVEDAGLLDRETYVLGTRWAVYSGVFETEAQAEAHMETLAQLGIGERFLKFVERAA